MYADYEYYEKKYLLGKEPVIVECDYLYYEKQARAEVDKITFNRCRGLDEIPEEVKDCVCDVAEYLCKYDRYSGSDAPGPLASFGNDGETGTYDLSNSIYTESKRKEKIQETLYKHLADTGLLYSGR